jgi:TPR repeat protein
MGNLKIVLAFVALLPISAIAQGPSSALRPKTGNEDFAALRKKALAGDTRSQLRLGIAFEFGQGVDKNFDEAMHWYRTAADRGDPIAQTNLGYFYEAGVGGSRESG